jgi:hypothetical protein
MRLHPRVIVLSLAFLGAAVLGARAQQAVNVNLSEVTTELQVHNRAVTRLQDADRAGIHMDARPGDGVAIIPGIMLADGMIDVDVRGRNAPGLSFVGVAFAVSDTGYEAVYLRPFNFRAEDPAARAHAVQYISAPDYPWNRLREEHPGEYEAAITPPPDPDGWVHLRVVLDGGTATVFVNHAAEPTLVVDRISEGGAGGVGLWVGNNAEGDFADLRVTPHGTQSDG